MKLENRGKLPIGMFAEMERLGTNLNEIDTSDCETSLESLKHMAARLCKNKEISVDASNTNGLLSPTTKPDPSLDIIKEEPMEVQAPQAPMVATRLRNQREVELKHMKHLKKRVRIEAQNCCSKRVKKW